MFDRCEYVPVVVKDSWINPLRKYTEGMTLHLLNEKGIQGIPSLLYEGQVRTLLIAGEEILANTHFIRSTLLRNPTSRSRDYHLHVLYHLITWPVGILITEFHSLGELLVAFLDYLIGECLPFKTSTYSSDRILAHKDARKIACILHHDVSLVNLLLAWQTEGRSCHETWMMHLSPLQRDLLKKKIKNLQWRGVLADWGYTVLLPTTTDEVTSNMPPTNTSSQNVSSENQVLVKSRRSAKAAPVLVPMSQLTQEDEIMVLSAKDWDKDEHDTINLNPLHCTISSGFICEIDQANE